MYADRIQAHNIMIRLQVSAVFHADCMAFANKSRASTDRHDSVSIYWHSVREFYSRKLFSNTFLRRIFGLVNAF